MGTSFRLITFKPIAMKMAKVFVAAACLLAAPAPAAAKDLRIGLSQYPSTLHPLIDSMVAKSYVLGMAQRPLAGYDAQWNPTCFLCTELPSFENGLAQRVDGTVRAVYKLKDLYWADGTPVTAQDARFAWEVGRHPQTGTSNADLFTRSIAKLDVIDDKTFAVTFDKEKCDFATLADFHLLPAHLEKKIFEEDPATYKNRTLYVTAPQTPGLWLGPYAIAATKTGNDIRMEKNAHWQGKKPAFDSIRIRAIENTAALSAALLAGDIDYIAGELGLTLDQALALEKRLDPKKFTVTYKPGLMYEHIDLNHDVPMLADARVRQALLLSIDRQAISAKIFGGHQPVADSNVSPLDEKVYNAAVVTYPNDPARAEKLFAEAGWSKGKDGILRNDKGEKFTLSFITTAGNKTREIVQQAVQSDWRKAGVDAQIRNEPPRVMFGETVTKRKFTGAAMYAWMGSPQNVPRTTMHSSMIPSAENAWSGQNYPGFIDARADEIIDALETACADPKRKALWAELQNIYAHKLPALPLYWRADPFILPVWLEGVTPTGHLGPSTLWIENWSRK